jgi:hypothetical protein
MHTVSPPPHLPTWEHRPKTQKPPTLNSPNQILFAIQHKIVKFLQYKELHLVTQFSVCLRVFPFSEPPPKKSDQKTQSNPVQLTQIPPIPHGPIIKGLRADLILYVTRFNVTHILIHFFIQDPFSHKFLKLS